MTDDICIASNKYISWTRAEPVSVIGSQSRVQYYIGIHLKLLLVLVIAANRASAPFVEKQIATITSRVAVSSPETYDVNQRTGVLSGDRPSTATIICCNNHSDSEVICVLSFFRKRLNRESVLFVFAHSPPSRVLKILETFSASFVTSPNGMLTDTGSPGISVQTDTRHRGLLLPT